MRFFKILGLCILGALAIGYFAWKINYPTYSYRYRLTVAVDVDGEIRTGSSVIEIIWEGDPGIGQRDSIYIPKIRGQAAFVDLKQHGALVALLRTGDTNRDLALGPRDATWIAGRAFGNRSTNPELPALERLKGKRVLSADDLPRFAMFSDPNNPRTAKKVEQPDLSLGEPNLRITSAEVEITNDPLLIDIDKKLPWLTELGLKERREHLIVQRPGEFKLMHSMFIGD